MPSNHFPNGFYRSGYIRWFWIFLIIYAIVCTFICIYFIANFSIPLAKNEYSRTYQTLKEIERRARDLSVINQQVDGVKVACQPVPREELRKTLGPAFFPRYMSEDNPEVDGDNVIIEESNTGSVQNDQKITKRKKHDLPFYVNSEFSRILFDEPVMSSEVDYVQPILEGSDLFNKIVLVTENPRDIEEVKIHKKTANKIIHRHRHNHQSKKLDDFKRKKPVESKLLDTDFEQSEPAEPPDVKNGFKSVKILETLIKTVIPDRKRPKRSASDVMPWYCKSVIKWLDLGPDYFPRFIRSVECVQKKCYWGWFCCQPKAFTVKVLKRIKDTCIENLTSEKSHKLYENGIVPRELREQWMFEEIAVTFCCECTMV